MRSVLVIAWYDIKRVLRERESLFWIFVGPLIFTVFFGLLFKPSEPQRPKLAVINQDASDDVLRGIQPWMERNGVAVAPATTVVPGRFTLVIPAGAAADIRDGKAAAFTLHAGADESNAERNVRFKLQQAVTRLYLGLDSASRAASGDGPLVVREADIGVARRETTTGFQRSVPAYLVMFVFLNLLVSGAGIAEDRASGRLRRISMAPVSRREIVLGKLLGRFAIGWIQIVYMLAFGLIVGIRWADHPWVFFGFLSLFALSSASLGILMGTLFTDPDKCASMAVWVAILLAPLGGLWWPLEIVGPVMRQLAYVVPTGWAMEGVNAMLAFGAGARDVAPFAAGFLALFAVSLPLAARRLRV
ncbi:MAG: ABC transporter permease [Acidobacteria bacterium]|nr:ABC transporter permease [Acidobacteriota bacterium]